MANIYISKKGDDTNGGTSWSDAKLTISGAVAIASDADVLNLGYGVWEENPNIALYDLTFKGKGRSLTTILGAPYLNGSYASNKDTTFQNIKFVVTDTFGYGYDFRVLGELTFDNAHIDFNGHGSNTMLYTSSGNPWTFTDSIICNASDQNNYGICSTSSAVVTLTRCVFYNNYTGVYTFRTSNTAAFVADSCIFMDMDEYLRQDTSSFTISNSCIYNWTGVSLGGDLTDGGGNIEVDPLFRDPVGGDFRLHPDSPCKGIL